MNLGTIQGNVGEWEDTISEVELIGTETVPVSGYPEAEIYLYNKRDTIENKPLVIYIHGGGWCTGKASAVEWYAKLLASNGYQYLHWWQFCRSTLIQSIGWNIY